MQPFTTLNAIAAPLPIENVDTDMIIPKQFLKTIKRTGLKEGLFYEMRFDINGKRNDDFILHREPYTHARVLVAHDNFGCGSSREHAPWALLDFGIRCVIAPSFADIFYNNCFKNGILPVILPKEAVEKLMVSAQAGQQIMVDLPSQTVKAGNHSFNFDLDPFRKRCLINGLDDIGLTMEKLSVIDSFEATQRKANPWLHAQ
ncbi:MAG: 3-isopropylmalate dehydratase small subunit [Candidatus Sungbacteria bacterium]|uniref:3-isopropylmalate dehydratase small subunit n=1 Tax=Candidatus Sungiibacteriota bacterium TaxID=2750080 RepID=A0A932QY05_9BACT|nr:3-isopropylmalate dehydratase small subunit [Candidatus Sungbacteria bacterium]